MLRGISSAAVWASELSPIAHELPAVAEVNRGTPAALSDRYNYDKTISISPR